MTDFFCKPERTNWLNAWIALYITQGGLQDFVDQEMQNVSNSMFQTVHSKLKLPQSTFCNACCTANLLKCPTQGVCKKRGKGNPCKSMHDTPTKQYRTCPSKICDEVRDLVIKEHRYGNPSWINTIADQWNTNHWQIAKCFLPKEGYVNVSSIRETDFNGIVNVLLNCKHFENRFSFSIAPPKPNGPCLLTKTREISRDIRHCPNAEVTNADLLEIFTTFAALLNDAAYLSTNCNAQNAVRKLNQLQNGTFYPTPEEIGHLLKRIEDLNNTKQTLEMLKDNLARTLEVYRQKSTTYYDESNYAQDADDVFRQLKKYYNVAFSKVPISTFLPRHDKHFLKMYVTPKIIKLDVHQLENKKQPETVGSYRDMFYTGSKIAKRIFLQGEPGTGKTSFAMKLLADWASKSSRRQAKQTCFNDKETLKMFKYVFHLELRKSIQQTEVAKMIKEQIIDMIYAEDEREKAYMIVLQILKREKCLIVQDGLDEWVDPTRKLYQPLVVFSHSHCTVLTTLRPWKIANEDINESRIDILLELKGVNDADGISRKILGCFFKKKDDLNYKCYELSMYIQTNKLEDVVSNPMMIELIVCSFVDGTCVKSMCDRNSILLDNLFKKASNIVGYFKQPPAKCLSNTKYIQPNIEYLNAISETAFMFLFNCEKDKSLAFTDVELSKYITNDQKSFFCKSGVLMERRSSSLMHRTTTCSFIHKTFQEFLAALYIAQKEDVINDKLTIYFDQFAEAHETVSQVFIYLCGLNIKAANHLSRLMDKHVNAVNAKSLQHIIISGYEEASANNAGDSEIHLYLSNVIFENRTFEKRDEILQCILMANKANVKSFSSEFEIPGYMKHIPSTDTVHNVMKASAHCLRDLHIRYNIHFGHLDLSACTNLETVYLKTNNTVLPNTFCGLQRLKSLKLICKCDGLNLISCNSLEQLHLGMDVHLMQNSDYKFSLLKSLRLQCTCCSLNLSVCQQLEEVCIKEPIVLLPLNKCMIATLKNQTLEKQHKWLDLSYCQLLKDVSLQGKFTILSDTLLALKDLRKITLFCKCDNLDLSSCTNLEEIEVGENVNIPSTTIMGLRKLKAIKMFCNYDGLDLSACNNLERIVIRGQGSLKPNLALKQLKSICVSCKCVGLDLTLCGNLYTVSLCKQVMLLPKGLHGLRMIKTLALYANCDGLDLRSCVLAESIHIDKQVTLLPEALQGLTKLKKFTLNGKCDGLDLSSCFSLKVLQLGRNVVLLPKSLDKLRKLTSITRDGILDGLDVLSSCPNLKTVSLKGQDSVLPVSLRKCSKIESVLIEGSCGTIHFSRCKYLTDLVLTGQHTIVSDALRNLINLKSLTLECTDERLDLSPFTRLKNVEFRGKVNVLPNTICKLEALTHITLHDTCDITEDITEVRGMQSPSWIRRIFAEIASLSCESKVHCTIVKCNHLQSEDTEVCLYVRVKYTDKLDMSKINLVCDGDTPALYNALNGSLISNLSLVGLRYSTLLVQTLPQMSFLSSIRIILENYVDIELPQSTEYVCVVYRSLTSVELRKALNQLVACDHLVYAKILFGLVSPLHECAFMHEDFGTLENVETLFEVVFPMKISCLTYFKFHNNEFEEENIDFFDDHTCIELMKNHGRLPSNFFKILLLYKKEMSVCKSDK